ncbi:hypothetical protein HNY73_013732 [Argiope bruennichi]|uniref:Reverse transcriptase/retrotransposon-derived protein RNase H-like domain-containing protein n=1 Tax=Argiope bruennichi TaxID=94029 RepID=A0A8T0EQN0_ARGBR|nr:hypothetical protein HNY73_013732 [Argiope bruennichi]
MDKGLQSLWFTEASSCKQIGPSFSRHNWPFILQTDASDNGMGVVLSQIIGDNQEHPIIYCLADLKE